MWQQRWRLKNIYIKSITVLFYRTDLGKCTHLYDEIKATIKHKRFRQKVFVRFKKIIIITKGKKIKKIMFVHNKVTDRQCSLVEFTLKSGRADGQTERAKER